MSISMWMVSWAIVIMIVFLMYKICQLIMHELMDWMIEAWQVSDEWQPHKPDE